MNIFITTYNILYGANKEVFKSIKKLNEIDDKYDYSFYGFQEARNIHKPKYIEENIEKSLKDYSITYNISDKLTNSDLGLSLASNIKPFKSEIVNLPRLKKKPWMIQGWYQEEMPLCGAIINYYDIEGKILRVTNLHLNNVGGLVHKLIQARYIKSKFDEDKADYDVIIGDFNTNGLVNVMRWQIQKQIHAILNVFGDEYKIANDDWRYTLSLEETVNPGMPFGKYVQAFSKILFKGFKQKTDWIIVRNLNVEKHDILYDLKGSDHYPVYAILSTKDLNKD